MREFSLRRSRLLLATLLSDRVPEGLEDVSKYANLFSSLYASGNWTLLDLKKLAGLNFLRVWREVEKVRDSQISTNIFFFGFQHDSKKLLESKPIFNWLCDNLNEGKYGQVSKELGGGAREELIPGEEQVLPLSHFL